MDLSLPVIKKIEDTPYALRQLEEMLDGENGKTQKILAWFPTVYIHNWKKLGKYDVYVGESNNIFKRTLQHYETGKMNSDSWQSALSENDSSLYIIGHEHFNKSMTLDVENRLMHYLVGVQNIRQVHNLRANPQGNYFPSEELDEIFSNIWSILRKYDDQLFPSVSEIKDSAIFKASPFHELTRDQKLARDLIVERVERALDNPQTGQLIFIEGEAGTGKTVLNSSTFYEIFCQADEDWGKNVRCCMIVNHNEQKAVYEQIAKKLGLEDKYGEVVYKPTRFITTHSKDNPVDVAFVDEAHLLLTQGKQAYRGENQLQDILERAKVTVVMFDQNQILTTEQYWEYQILERYRKRAIQENNYMILKDQLRIHADKQVIEWIDGFTNEQMINPIPNSPDYDIRIFESPETLDEKIKEKSQSSDTALSRLIATYDWEYNLKRRNERLKKYWEVIIGNWHKPWNYELEKELSSAEKRKIKSLAWAEQPQTINEVGSTFTIQGFDLNYAGVILGHSVKYRDGKIVYDPDESCNTKAIRNRTLSDGSKRKFGEQLLQHEVRVLMTRGVNGLYIYACDDELRNALLNAR